MTSSPRVAIIGTGFGGIAAAIKLLKDGVDDIVLLERYADTGGTWRDNRYPGAACDIPSHLYSLSFEPKSDWTRHYAPADEIKEYLDDVVAKHGLRERTRFGFDVREMVWDDTTATWTLTSATGDTVTAEIVVNAIGGLKDPAYPSIDGLASFAGPTIHTARWDHDLDLDGKRVAVIGTGASAIQIIPELAKVAGSLTVMQRTAPWVIPRLDRGYGPLQRAVIGKVPGVRQALRASIFVENETFRYAFTAGTPLNKFGETLARTHLRRQVKDRALRELLTPSFTFGCKRVLRSDDYYPALTQDNVHVETTDIASIDEAGLVLADGSRVDVDVIVLATGFKVLDVLNGAVVRGRDGVDLEESWRGRPSAHLGMMSAGFPNTFMLMGPNTALGHNSVVLQIESSVTFVREAVKLMRTGRYASMEVAPEAHRRWLEWIDSEIGGSTWSDGCASWYLNPQGENFTIWPGSVPAYRRATRKLDLGSYILRRPSQLTPTTPDRTGQEITA